MISSLTDQLASDLSDAILGSTDKQVVAEGLPAYLLLVDALVESDSNNANLLNTAALLNGSYASAFLTDVVRQQQFATKAKRLAARASCIHSTALCDLDSVSFDVLLDRLEQTSTKDLDFLYTLGSSWAGWIQAHSDDFVVVAELPRAKALLERVISLDETYSDGSALMYMGVFATFLPPALGGQPELGLKYFEKANEVSQGRNLYAKILMVENVARPMFDRELHDRLLQEVLDSDPNAGDLTLQNVIAQEQAIQLKASADDFF